MNEFIGSSVPRPQVFNTRSIGLQLLLWQNAKSSPHKWTLRFGTRWKIWLSHIRYFCLISVIFASFIGWQNHGKARLKRLTSFFSTFSFFSNDCCIGCNMSSKISWSKSGFCLLAALLNMRTKINKPKNYFKIIRLWGSAYTVAFSMLFEALNP